jgi:iron-sulfur cluster insertion protein
MTSDVLYLTPKAAQKIAEAQGVLRVQVKGGGCSGMRYIFTMEPEASEKDVRFTQHNSSIITDPLSLHFIAEYKWGSFCIFSKTSIFEEK